MDGTDAHIEGNIFINTHQDAARDSTSSCITTGAGGGATSQLVICRNLFYDCEHAILLKDHGSALVQNNTIVHVTPNPLDEQPSGVILFGEPHRGDPYGDGAIFEGNIAADLTILNPWPALPGAQSSNNAFLSVTRSLIQGFPQPGEGNLSVDPQFVSQSGIDASNILQRLALDPSSPCRGTGPNGLDMGALVPGGASVTGEPPSVTTATGATLRVRGPGIWSYKWRLDGGPWSPEISLVPAAIWNGAPLTAVMFAGAPDIVLTGLGPGAHTVEVLGRDSAGVWQAEPGATKSWTVQSATTDADADGMTDDWELANGLNPGIAADAFDDGDGDGADNLDEFISGTDPRDGGSVLRLEIETAADGTVALGFDAVAGKSYCVEFSPTLATDSWQSLARFPSQPGSGRLKVPDPEASLAPRRFYRLITPAP